MKILERYAPGIFVIIWASGFVVAKYAFKSSDVIFFLSIRLFIASAILAIITKVLGQSLTLSRKDLLASLAIGITLHAIYLGGVWEAIAQGSPSGIASVITSLQPVLVSLIAVRLLGEALTRRQLIGLFLGLAGVALVLAPAFSRAGEMTLIALLLLFAALSGSTSATLLQKKLGRSIPLLAGTTYQFLIAAVVLGLFSLFTGKTSMEWNLESTLAMAWAVVVTSLIAILLLLWMLTRGSAARVTSLLYLVPPTTAIQAFILFGEKLTPTAIIGIAMTATGVALVQKR
ncbi:RhaT Permeases of the drug/metabolite transporter (DMT) superfamily [Candidatus Nanopelagicaceae bacterium]